MDKYNKDILHKTNKLICPKCGDLFELPEGGLESLKKNECIESLRTKTITMTCGVCSGMDIKSFCINCRYYLCTFCTSSHQKIPALKDHFLPTIDSSKKGDIEVSYCKSCQKWVNCENTSDHNSCKLISFSELTQELFEKLQQEIAQNNGNIDFIKGNLGEVNSRKLSISKEAEDLKMHVQQHCEDIKNTFNKLIDLYNNEFNEDIDKKCDAIKRNLDMFMKETSKLSAELAEQNDKHRSILKHFDPASITEAIEHNMAKPLNNYENIIIKNQKLISESSNKKVDVSFVPNLSYECLLISSRHLIGKLMSTEHFQPELIQTVKTLEYVEYLSVTPAKLYLVADVGEMYGVEIHCSETYKFLSSIDFSSIPHVQFSKDFNKECTIVDDFLFYLCGNLIEIYDLQKNENNPDWKRSITLGFHGTRFFHSSDVNLFISGKKCVFETSLEGEIVNFIKLPDCTDSNNVDNFIRLKMNCFVISELSNIYLFNSYGNVLKKINSTVAIDKYNQLLLRTSEFNLFLADRKNEKIHIFDFNLNLVKIFNAHCRPQNLGFDLFRFCLLVQGGETLNVFQL